MFNNIYYEKCLNGAILNNNESLESVFNVVSADDFHDSLQRKIFNEAVRQINNGETTTIETVFHKIRECPSEIASLTSFPSSANISFYAEQVRELALKRKLHEIAGSIGRQINDDVKSSEIIDNIECKLTSLSFNKADNYKPIKDFVVESLKGIEADSKVRGISGISTGFKNLDSLTGGFQKGEMIVIGARPSIGKTAIALNSAEYIARKEIPVAFFSLEMSGFSLTKRLLCGNSKVSYSYIATGDLTEDDLSRLSDTASEIYDLPLFIYDFPNAMLSDLKLKARKLVRVEKIQILFIDYIGLIKVTGNAPRWEKVGMISSEIKALSQDLNIPIVILSQVTRAAEDKPPTLADLRESGSIEQDADLVMFLHRKRNEAETQLMISKNRNGICGVVKLKYSADETKFYSA